MVSVWSQSRSSAATSPGTGSLLQSTAEVNIVFVNIDWKRSRHDTDTSTKKNLKKLADTITSIVQIMEPAVICCCEVGTAMEPMTNADMSAMVSAMKKAWQEAATEHPCISSLFDEKAPYITMWDERRCRCTDERILENLYTARGQPRTAQAFLCTMAGVSDEEPIEIINVHAPSGKDKLTDSQRYQLMTNLLQSNSIIRVGKSIGKSRFLIGGDMNTTELKLSQILFWLHNEGVLTTPHDTRLPIAGRHGDICVVGGFTTTTLTKTAENHDHQHVPYGITWLNQPQHATEQLTAPPQKQLPTAPDTTTESRATEATAVAAVLMHQQRDINLANTTTALDTTASRPQLQRATGELTVMLQTQISIGATPTATVPKKVQPDLQLNTLPQHATEQLPTTLQMQDPTAVAAAAVVPVAATAAAAAAVAAVVPEAAAAAVAATEAAVAATPNQLQPVLLKQQPPTTDELIEADRTDASKIPELTEHGQKMAYVIVNAFLDNVTFKSIEVEKLITEVIVSMNLMFHEDSLRNIDKIFLPIFVHYPNGLKDRSLAVPRDAIQYIKQWRDIDTWRPHDATGQLGKDEVKKIKLQYIQNFIDNEATATQKQDPYNHNKSRAEARLRNLCGSFPMAKLIWELSLPNIKEAKLAIEQILLATEQQRPLEKDVQDLVRTATRTIVDWVIRIANLIQDHRETPGYIEHARKSGTEKNTSGLNDAERIIQAEKRRVAEEKHGRRSSTAYGSDR